MKKFFFGLFFLFAQLLPAQTIGIDVDAISKIVNVPPTAKNKESVVEVVPVEKVPSYSDVMPRRLDENDLGNKSMKQGANEDTRDDFIKALRVALEKGRDFKYYYPNFDYGQFKKELEQMMRDAVSQ
ncbi:MAG: hypothetical protein PHT07_10615 [Paludibacter sp.]|nr:hypothetical protein [Paludibacter sp.]